MRDAMCDLVLPAWAASACQIGRGCAVIDHE